MEDRYDELTRVLAGLEEAVGEYEDFKDELEVLKDYMESGEWKEDYEADEAGQLPSDLKRGILAEGPVQPAARRRPDHRPRQGSVRRQIILPGVTVWHKR